MKSMNMFADSNEDKDSSNKTDIERLKELNRESAEILKKSIEEEDIFKDFCK